MATTRKSGKTYNSITISSKDLVNEVSTLPTSIFAINSTRALVRKAQEKFETYQAMGNLVDGEGVLRHLLRSPDVRNEFEHIIPNVGALESVLINLFGNSGNVEAGNPRYSSLNVINAVNATPGYKDMGTSTRLLIAACLCDVLDVFKMRQESTNTSWIYQNDGELSPSLDTVISELVEVSLADSIKHDLEKVRKELSKDVPKRRFVIFAYTQMIHSAFRELALALNKMSYRELWMRDIAQLTARYLVNDTKQMATYGLPRANQSIEALVNNATWVRLCAESYDPDHICTIPVHEMKTEADFIGRNLERLPSYDVINNVQDVVQLSGHRRSQTGALVSAIINGVRKSRPDAHVYTVVSHGMANDPADGFVDVINSTAKFKALLPHLPTDWIDRLMTDTVIMGEEAAMAALRTKFTSMVLARANVSDELLHDCVAMQVPVTFSYEGNDITIVYEVIDTEKRLAALSPRHFNNMPLTNAALAFAVITPFSESIVTKPLFASEALVTNLKFTGVWEDRVTVPLTDMHVTIKDLLASGDADDPAVESFTLPIFGEKKALPNFLELQATDGWGDVIDLLNAMARDLNTSGSQKSQLQRNQWVNQTLGLLADWVNKDVALHSLVMRAVSEFSRHAQREDLPEEFFLTNSYYFATIAQQCALGVIEAMSQASDNKTNISQEFVKLLSTPESLSSFASMVSPR